MTQYYIKNKDGEYVDADELVEKGYQEKSSKIVSSKLNAGREKMEASIREEIAESVRKETTEAIKQEVTDELEAKHKEELKAVNDKATGLETQLRRKTIAAAYGFKEEVEQFLGDGSEEDMRAKADALKDSFKPEKATSAPDKQTKDTSASSSFISFVD